MAKKIVKKSKKTCGSKKNSGCKKSCVKNVTSQCVEQQVVSLPMSSEPVSFFGKIKSFFGF